MTTATPEIVEVSEQPTAVVRGRVPWSELPALWEVYLTEPSPDMDPADLRTELNWLLE